MGFGQGFSSALVQSSFSDNTCGANMFTRFILLFLNQIWLVHCAYFYFCISTDPVKHKAEEHTFFKITFPSHGIGKYKKFEWWKEDSMIVEFGKSDNKLIFYNDFCDSNENGVCTSSKRGYFNITSGELMIYNVTLNDEAKYYYRYQQTTDEALSPVKFQVILEVDGKLIY